MEDCNLAMVLLLRLDWAPTAAQTRLKKAYFCRALQCHPDKGGSTQEFQRLQNAYSLLRAQDEPKHEQGWENDF